MNLTTISNLHANTSLNWEITSNKNGKDVLPSDGKSFS